MSSTYAHYQPPSSLPSDYAIVSQMNAHGSTLGPDDDDDELSSTVVPDSLLSHPRRASFPAPPYYRPKKPTIGSYPRDGQSSSSSSGLFPSPDFPSETTPLLNNPPIPRIEESIDQDPSADDESKITMFWEELWILAKYALPVFGLVFPLHFCIAN